MFEYAFVTLGYTRIIKASDKYSAVEQALEVASDVRAHSWLLYDRQLNLIYSVNA